MRKFHVKIETTEFELEVEEFRTVPFISARSEHQRWADAAHKEAMTGKC